MNAGPSSARYITPDAPPCHGFQYNALSACTAAIAATPPAPWSASGSATAKPASFTASCTMFTQADVSRPPAVKYAITTPPPTRLPRYFGMPVTTSRIVAMAINCPAGIASEPIHSSTETLARTRRPYRSSRKSPTVLRSCAAANRRIRGPIHSASTTEPRAAAPPGGQAVSVAETGRADGRSPADVGGEHRREDEAGAEPAAGDEEVPRARDPPADPQPETDQQRRVAEQEAEVQRHRARYCGRSRAAGTPAVLVASRIARTIASATTSAAIAPMAATSAAPRQPPVASVNTVSPSALVWTGAIARG